MTTITAVVNAHREGVLVGPSLGSFIEAVEYAEAHGATVECLAVLDSSEPITREMFQGNIAGRIRVVESEYRDSGLARNRAVAEAAGEFVAFLDGDDLWSYNWLDRALATCQKRPLETVAHPELNAVFGGESLYYWHADTEVEDFDPEYLQIGNYWSALSFASRSIYTRFPFLHTDHQRGYGHEDWHWNRLTVEAGILHRAVPGTVHFIRRRQNSVSRQAIQRDVVTMPSPSSRFKFEFHKRSGRVRE